MKDTTPVNMIRQRRGADLTLLAFGSAYGELVIATLTSLLNYYYVYTHGLSNAYFAIAQIVYAIYVSIMGPVIGFVTNRRYKFTKKLGRTTPFIFGGGIAAVLVAILVYLAPVNASQIGLLFWMLFTLSITSTFYAMYSTNFSALQPVILRDKKQRAGFGIRVVIFGTTGMILGFVIPEFGDITTSTGYLIPMFIMAGVGIAMLFGMLPAIKEEPALTDELLRRSETTKFEFFSILWKVVKLKNFALYILVYLAFQIICATALSSLPFFEQYILLIPREQINMTRTIVILVEFAAVYVSLPIWSWLMKKLEFKTTFGICGFFLALTSAPILFITTKMQLFVTFAFIGIAVGGFWSLLEPLFGDIMDEACVKIGGHVAGISAGVKQVIGKIALIAQALIYLLVRNATSFEPSKIAPTEATSAMLFGIRFEMIAVGGILLMIASIIFLIKYDLVGEKMKNIKDTLNSNVTILPTTQKETAKQE